MNNYPHAHSDRGRPDPVSIRINEATLMFADAAGTRELLRT
jgi:hypothetical protein